MFLEKNSLIAQNTIDFLDDYELQKKFSFELFNFIQQKSQELMVSEGVLTKVSIKVFVFCFLENADDKKEDMKKAILNYVKESIEAFEEETNGTE